MLLKKGIFLLFGSTCVLSARLSDIQIVTSER